MYFILNMYGPVIVFVAGLLVAILCFVKNPNFVWKFPFAPEDDFISRHKKGVNRGIYWIIFVISITGLVLSIPRLADIKAVLTNDFETLSGIVISQDYADTDENVNRMVTIHSPATGDEEKYYIFQCRSWRKGNGSRSGITLTPKMVFS